MWPLLSNASLTCQNAITIQCDQCWGMTDLHEMLLEKQRNSKEVICVLEGEEFEMFGSIFNVDSLLILNNIRATWMSHPSLCLTSQFLSYSWILIFSFRPSFPIEYRELRFCLELVYLWTKEPYTHSLSTISNLPILSLKHSSKSLVPLFSIAMLYFISLPTQLQFLDPYFNPYQYFPLSHFPPSSPIWHVTYCLLF